VDTDAVDFLSAMFLPEFREDPYPFYRAMQETAPLQQIPLGTWTVNRFADANAILRDPRFSTNQHHSRVFQQMVESGLVSEEDELPIDETLLFLDPPDHTRIRSLISKAFTPRTVERLRPHVEDLCDQLIAPLRDKGTFYLVSELAYPLPVQVICELLGVPASDHVMFESWSRVLAHGIDPAPLQTPAIRRALFESITALQAYFVELFAARRRNPRDDLLSALVQAEQDGDRLSEAELHATCIFLLIAGHETTVNLIGNGMLALLHNPAEADRLRADPRLLAGAVEELLRYDSPVQFTIRISTDDVCVAGRHLPAGEAFIVIIGAANRDPDEFVDPDRLDVSRNPHHLGFGGGIHFCLGAALARMEAQIVVGRVLDAFPNLELAGPPTRRPTFTLRGLAELPVATR
jgi:pimeloyl-[acyl-carrier protein] synthase